MKGIQQLAFRPAQKASIGFEIFRLSELLARLRSGRVGHAPLASLRMEFHVAYIGTAGLGELMVDFARVPLGAGWLTFVAIGQVHQYLTLTAPPDAWMLMFSPEFLALGARQVDPLRGSHLLAGRSTSVRLPPRERQALLALCELASVEYARPADELHSAVLASLLRTMLLRGERLASPSTPLSPMLEHFFTILERDVMTTRSVTHYAKIVGLSTRRLGELVLAHSGQSTKQIIGHRLALEVKRLLAHTDLSVKELAARAGFAEPTNFVKFFRHHAGTTPLAFRARFHHQSADLDLVGARAHR